MIITDAEFSQTYIEMGDADPLDKIVKINYIRSLVKGTLTKLEQHVIYQHFYQGRRLKDIGFDSDFPRPVSEGRVCQIKQEAIKKLQLKAINQANKYGYDNVAKGIDQ